ncbi:hypothetical protein MLD38_010513 [Melastoma candidum]|uniref:Uncharacterized protein n=1 Tax=Melastoma candidum TaxID=119954 RepID=A0ACB9R061_9MYRT|nr:hypothetical protein MLD38_010513 [Melastoma candidum]
MCGIPLPGHRVMFPFFFLAIFTCHAAAQPPLPPPSLPFPPLPPPPPPPQVDFNPMVAMLITLTVSALFFIIFFSIYIIDCTSAPPEPDVRWGRSPRGVPLPKGLDAGVVAGFPTFVYSEVKEHKIGKGALECAVCLCEFEDYETLRLIPKCDHVFHPECINEWLSGHVTCPVCRANLAPQSGDSVKGRTADSGQEEQDSVEIEVDELASVSEAATRVGNGEAGAEQTAMDNTGESVSGKPARRRLGRSHSTGHSLVPRGEDMERFTLRLPEEVRNQIMERPTTPYFPSEGSSRRGFRSGDGSSRGRLLRRLDRLDRMDRPAKSERWIFSRMPSFLSRVSSMVPPKYANDGCGADRPEKSTSSRDRTVKPSESAAGLNIV